MNATRANSGPGTAPPAPSVEGAKVPPTIITLDDIAEVSATASAYAALRHNGNVVTCGNALGGGDSETVQSLLNGQVSYYRSTPESA
ncbi:MULTISPECIES: hypothetical protein [Pseudomonas]|uniref:hypothetical protein n=1 Tax=Pseudomonas TaxID=286 RepID=UPI000CD55D64|nr:MULTISPECIES: hypothetical protein [Pseudomonas]RBH55531.1 hypothetical protein C3F00_018840 [Pseudomonas sp. MWU13-2860]